MRDFDKQLERYMDELKNVRCPYSEAELDKEIRSVVWNILMADKEETVKPKPAKHKSLWPVVAAAALAAIIIPTVLLVNKPDSDIELVDVDGQRLYFACNNGCSPECTLEAFKNIVE